MLVHFVVWGLIGAAQLIVHFTVVSFPYFPAEIINETVEDDEIPQSVFDDRTRSSSAAKNGTHGGHTWLVCFFDVQASYGWIPKGRLDTLGVDDGAGPSTMKIEPG